MISGNHKYAFLAFLHIQMARVVGTLGVCHRGSFDLQTNTVATDEWAMQGTGASAAGLLA